MGEIAKWFSWFSFYLVGECCNNALEEPNQWWRCEVNLRLRKKQLKPHCSLHLLTLYVRLNSFRNQIFYYARCTTLQHVTRSRGQSLRRYARAV